jgi:Skp family chaperone for outer membrane proteins
MPRVTPKQQPAPQAELVPTEDYVIAVHPFRLGDLDVHEGDRVPLAFSALRRVVLQHPDWFRVQLPPQPLDMEWFQELHERLEARYAADRGEQMRRAALAEAAARREISDREKRQKELEKRFERQEQERAEQLRERQEQRRRQVLEAQEAARLRIGFHGGS